MSALLIAFALLVAGFALAALVQGPVGRAAGFLATALGGAAALLAAGDVLAHGARSWRAAPALHLALRVDPLAAAFLGIVGAVGVVVGIYGLGARTADERGDGRAAACATAGVLFASLLVCTADDALLFVFGWELLALAFYQAIAYAGTDPRGPSAAYLTLLLTHGAAAGLLAAFVVVGHGTFGLPTLLAAGASATPLVRGVAFALFLCAFGAKVGILPFPIWMARGYTAAPSLVAAMMAGGALNVGFYGIARVGLGMSGATPLWWGLLVMACGALAAFFGIAWAAVQRDARTLAAYSSVENAGIVLVGLGVAIAARALDLPFLCGIGVAAALAHATAHALAKCTLFLACAAVRADAGTTSFQELGGLWRSLPLVTVVVLAAAGSLVALPPSGGFAGEWMTLEALLQAFRTGNVTATITFALSGATIGIAAGVAIVAFVKLVGIGFLGAPRTPAAERASAGRDPFRGAALVLGAVGALGVGILAPQLISALGPTIDGLAGVPATARILADAPVIEPAFAGFSSAWPLGLGLVVGGFAAAFAVLVALIRRPRSARVPVWTSGEAYRPWTQYTGVGYANPTRVILDLAVRARAWVGVAVWNRIGAAFLRAADVVRETQSGVIALYLSYILVFTIVMLLLFPAVRHW
ncbi:MAG TPA: proton-conducting transporter membrane subunit [Candidatus Sulfotelmatobacter sp.]|nr:proton-conducting transporter membrane subunit [Candidatus Sulfotelmatobacter sp.]